jgi:hypothetical protein
MMQKFIIKKLNINLGWNLAVDSWSWDHFYPIPPYKNMMMTRQIPT